ncbi:DinB family protein [Rurimicrobium arvi]|uniref:DinB-like domain-containing protein n=1 Tax=Rurimicrobium arvi TaxID=2049916 RepID=A0ABP8MRU1_9BACT
MNNTARLSQRLEEVFLSGKWIANTNYTQELQQTSVPEANTRIGNLNTIAVLCYHINYYLEGLLKVLQGGPLEISDRFSFDAPEISTASAWEQRVQSLRTNAWQFTEAVSQLSDAQLEAPFVQEQYGTWQRNIEAVIEHSYYHLGQIVLIRKMLSGNTAQ